MLILKMIDWEIRTQLFKTDSTIVKRSSLLLIPCVNIASGIKADSLMVQFLYTDLLTGLSDLTSTLTRLGATNQWEECRHCRRQLHIAKVAVNC